MAPTSSFRQTVPGCHSFYFFFFSSALFPSSLQVLKGRRERKQRLLESVPPGAREVLRQVVALRKRAAKRR